MITIPQLNAELLRLSASLDDALDELFRQAPEYAEAEDAFKAAWAQAYLLAEGRTVKDRECEADLAAREERKRALIAEALRRAAVKAVEARMAQLSALQSIGAGLREEISLARSGPRSTP